MRDWIAIWDAANNRGEGFAVAGDDINKLDLGKLIERAVSDREVAVYQRGDTHTLVGDAHGPWAIQVPVTDRYLLALY